MRLNIKDIMFATACTEEEANQVETEINNRDLLDWSECDQHEIDYVARIIYAELKARPTTH